MPSKRHRRLSITALALLGTVLGAASGYWLGHITLLRTANAALSDYASEFIAHADEYGAELSSIKKTFNPSAYPFCSREEIAEMQAMTFRSLQVKEIGRTHNGMLFCSAFLGRLPTPVSLPKVTMTLRDGTHIYVDTPVMSAARSRGTIVESQGVDVILSPNAFDHWSREHTRFMVVVIKRDDKPDGGQMAQIAGEKLDADPTWILSQNDRRSGGEMYRARCSTHSPACIVTTESTRDALQGNSALLIEYSCLGGVAGFGLGLAIGQFYLRSIGLAQQLRRALRKDALRLVYQPILELPSRDCAGAEALVRWSDEDGNPIAPDFFVRIAEDKGFVGELTSFVIRRAVREVGDVLRKNPGLTLSVNISASDLETDTLFQLLETHVRQAGILPRQIALELTERSTADLSVLREAILHLHREGYKIHIDDFGTGFSSLSYLHELAIDAIKIDRTFTRTLGTDSVIASILPQILSLAESLQLEVIVEGVETEAQAEYLIATGKHMQAQGWCFGKPVIASELPKYHEQRKNASADAPAPAHASPSHAPPSHAMDETLPGSHSTSQRT